ncbi:MAG: NnrU family protein [Marinicaulis sp.]|nr:NnrU family protein [Marinicaulis sp.]NNE42510.1 NnrU family protein [Marinicaulis sp.]NNL87542.1 NnrU family protein [Marinicaulis sp.]
MSFYLAGLIIFFGSHFFTAFARGPREILVTKLGAGPYRGLYSLVALIGFALIIFGWRGADTTIIYTPPLWMRHVTYLLVLVAFILLASSMLPAGKIAAGAKHPMLAGVKLWAFAHLLVNGDERSLLLFGSFLAFAVIDRIVVKRRGVESPTAGPIKNDVIAIAVGAGLYIFVAFYAHRYIAGVSLG